MIDVVIQMLLFQWGHIQGNIVTCPMNGARFDITTGKKVSDPKFPSIETDSLPENLQKYTEYVGRKSSIILTNFKTIVKIFILQQ
jgi:nitrite reductase/ring-hydroxylating ferredoxin subunit